MARGRATTLQVGAGRTYIRGPRSIPDATWVPLSLWWDTPIPLPSDEDDPMKPLVLSLLSLSLIATFVACDPPPAKTHAITLNGHTFTLPVGFTIEVAAEAATDRSAHRRGF